MGHEISTYKTNYDRIEFLLDEYSFGELDDLEERQLEDEQKSILQYNDLMDNEISDSDTTSSATKITSLNLSQAQQLRLRFDCEVYNVLN
ncbi:MAG: hypothetical protein IH840_03080 [Candidatus Heimdallarchaeota archaeon]|nr:hypothetical protein [Candidatus Heimdallarchaeota archaeon]